MDSLFEIKDLNASTLFSLYSSIKSINSGELDITSDKELRLIIITDFGYISPNEILPNKSNVKKLTKENISDWIFQTSIQARNEMLDENENNETRKSIASFILKDVTICPFNATKHTLQNLILFSDKVTGAFVADNDFLQSL